MWKNIITMIGIYKIENTLNGKLYIGSSSNIKERLINHKSMLRCNKHHSIYLQNAYNKYGVSNFVFEVIEECKLEDLIIKEQNYINKYNFKNLYNILPKSSPGFCKKHKRKSIIKSQRTRGFSSIYKIDIKGNILNEYDLISDIEYNSSRIYRSIKKQQTLKNEEFGFIYSKDYIKGYKPNVYKSWNKNKKYKQNNFKSYVIYVYDIYGRFYKKYKSLRDCGIDLKESTSNIHRKINNKNFRNRKYLYFTEKQFFNNIITVDEKINNNTIKVFTIFDEFLGYSTPKKISNILKCSNSNIYQVLNNQRIQCKGYKFQIL